MSAPTPPGAMPTIRPGMKISFSLESLIALIGGVVFCTTTYWKLDVMDERVERIEKALGITENHRVPDDSITAAPILYRETQP